MNGQLESTDPREILDSLDKERNEASLAIYKMQTLLRLCLEYEYSAENRSPEKPLDWFCVFAIFDGLVSQAEEKLNEVDGFTTRCQSAIEKFCPRTKV